MFCSVWEQDGGATWSLATLDRTLWRVSGPSKVSTCIVLLTFAVGWGTPASTTALGQNHTRWAIGFKRWHPSF